MKLTNEQRRQLYDGLLSAFNDSSLKRLLSFELDKKLPHIASKTDFSDVVFQVIDTSEMEGWTEELIQKAYEERPKQENLQSLAQELGLQMSIEPVKNDPSIFGRIRKLGFSLDVGFLKRNLSVVISATVSLFIVAFIVVWSDPFGEIIGTSMPTPTPTKPPTSTPSAKVLVHFTRVDFYEINSAINGEAYFVLNVNTESKRFPSADLSYLPITDNGTYFLDTLITIDEPLNSGNNINVRVFAAEEDMNDDDPLGAFEVSHQLLAGWTGGTFEKEARVIDSPDVGYKLSYTISVDWDS